MKEFFLNPGAGPPSQIQTTKNFENKHAASITLILFRVSIAVQVDLNCCVARNALSVTPCHIFYLICFAAYINTCIWATSQENMTLLHANNKDTE